MTLATDRRAWSGPAEDCVGVLLSALRAAASYSSAGERDKSDAGGVYGVPLMAQVMMMMWRRTPGSASG